MKWFNNPKTVEDLKEQYRRLAMAHHPDKGGNVEDMKEINNEYDRLFKILKNVHRNAEGKTYTAKEGTREQPNEYRDIIDKLIHFDGIEIEICGSWIWVTGNTYNHKDVLKSLRFGWSKSKKAWYYHSDNYTKISRRSFTLDEIRDFYGSEKVQSEPLLKLAIV